MEETLKPFLGYFFPGECYHRVVGELNFLHVPCLKLLCSRILSFQVILGALIVKVPQILKILRASSVENLSYLTFFLELAAVTFTCTYSYAKGFPFSTWGESLFIAIQVIILLGLLFYYNEHMMYTGIFVPVYGTAVWYLTSGLASMELLSTLQASVIILMLASRLSQVVATFMNKTTGQLSFITSFLNWAGTAARIFTTVQETEDPILILMYISSFTVNSIILLQFLIYWNVSPSGKEDTDKQKKET